MLRRGGVSGGRTPVTLVQYCWGRRGRDQVRCVCLGIGMDFISVVHGGKSIVDRRFWGMGSGGVYEMGLVLGVERRTIIYADAEPLVIYCSSEGA